MESGLTNQASDCLISGENLLRLLQDFNEQLQEEIAAEDWAAAQETAKNRQGLLEQLSAVVQQLPKDSRDETVLALRRRIKWVLEDIHNDNDAQLAQVQEKTSAAQQSINEVKKGRRAVGLYRKPGFLQPRFLNKMG